MQTEQKPMTRRYYLKASLVTAVGLALSGCRSEQLPPEKLNYLKRRKIGSDASLAMETILLAASGDNKNVQHLYFNLGSLINRPYDPSGLLLYFDDEGSLHALYIMGENDFDGTGDVIGGYTKVGKIPEAVKFDEPYKLFSKRFFRDNVSVKSRKNIIGFSHDDPHRLVIDTFGAEQADYQLKPVTRIKYYGERVDLNGEPAGTIRDDYPLSFRYSLRSLKVELIYADGTTEILTFYNE